jgi:diguanylate cyclase (GGDEF)-like protein/PAS domain S-box-containing protein
LDVTILTLDMESSAILHVNRRMCEMFGYSPSEALTIDLGDLSIGISPCSRVEALEFVQKAAQGEPQNFEWLAKDKNGRPFWVDMFLRLMHLGGEDRLLATARDITERKQLEAEQAGRLKRAEAQNAVFLALAGVGSDFQAALDLITHHLAIQIGDLCILDMLEADETLHAAALSQPYLDGSRLMPELAALPQLTLKSAGPGEVASTGESLRVTDPSRAKINPKLRSEFLPYLERYGIHSLVIVPMRAQGKSIGTITLVKGGSSRPYSAEDQTMLQSLADRAALAITNAKLNAENLRQAEELRQSNIVLEQRVAERTAELGQANERLQRLAIEDALTGLANRRRFNEIMDEEIRRARRSGHPFAMLLCDVDQFKRFNDHYGHQAGDGCLSAVGATMGQLFRRAGELPARYGGEEFAVVLPDHDAEKAMLAAEMLRKAIEALEIPHAKSDVSPFVTLSIGVITSKVNPKTDATWYIERADEALYRSKSEGRNRALLAEVKPEK